MEPFDQFVSYQIVRESSTRFGCSIYIDPTILAVPGSYDLVHAEAVRRLKSTPDSAAWNEFGKRYLKKTGLTKSHCIQLLKNYEQIILSESEESEESEGPPAPWIIESIIRKTDEEILTTIREIRPSSKTIKRLLS